MWVFLVRLDRVFWWRGVNEVGENWVWDVGWRGWLDSRLEIILFEVGLFLRDGGVFCCLGWGWVEV